MQPAEEGEGTIARLPRTGVVPATNLQDQRPVRGDESSTMSCRFALGEEGSCGWPCASAERSGSISLHRLPTRVADARPADPAPLTFAAGPGRPSAGIPLGRRERQTDLLLSLSTAGLAAARLDANPPPPARRRLVWYRRSERTR